MTTRYALGWWAALIILMWGPAARRSMEDGSGITAIMFSLIFVTLLSYWLARLGWRRGWFRKP